MKSMKTKNMNKKSKIPEFNSYAEEAKFWDTHDTTEFLDELRPVNVVFRPDSKVETLTIKLTTDVKAALARYADARHLGASSLARAWIVEKLEEVTKAGEKRAKRAR